MKAPDKGKESGGTLDLVEVPDKGTIFLDMTSDGLVLTNTKTCENATLPPHYELHFTDDGFGYLLDLEHEGAPDDADHDVAEFLSKSIWKASDESVTDVWLEHRSAIAAPTFSKMTDEMVRAILEET